MNRVGIISRLRRDVERNAVRYRWLFLLFILVYFGEVVLAKALGQLTSPERQFWLFWVLASALLLIPFELSVVAAIFSTLFLGIGIALGISNSLIYDLAFWTFVFMVSAFISVMIQAKRHNG